jgi:UDP-3-O-acyl N-acetylglucosamine deacetylase
MVRLRFLPAPPFTGVVFVRTDLRPQVHVPARLDMVTGTQRRTTLGQPPGQIGLVEHVLAALAGLRIDNCYVELNAPEPPGLDGSARRFVDALSLAHPVVQAVRREISTVDSPVIVARHGATLTLHPAERDELRISYVLDYGKGSPIGWQMHTQTITPEGFASEIAPCRTFILESEADELRRQGLGARTTAADLLVFGNDGVIDNELRFANEPARHKILDIVGDLLLLGCDLRGHVVAYRSGHPLNVELVRCLLRGACTELAPLERAAA